MTKDLIVTSEFKEKVKKFKKDFYSKYKAISEEETPRIDGTGKKIVGRRPDGYDYIIEAYMRECLDKHFPGWSWEMGGAPQFLGTEWVFVWGTLSIIDEHLLAFGINPPIRKFSATNGVRVKFKKDQEHIAINVIDIGNDVASANSKAFKKAINQLTHIGDDIYGKRIEEEGAGSFESVFDTSPDKSNFALWFENTYGGKNWNKAFILLDIKSLDEIQDFKKAKEVLTQKL